MAQEQKTQIELLPEEQALLLEYDYPFQAEKEQLNQLPAIDEIGILTNKPYYLSLLIGNLSYRINKRTTSCYQNSPTEICDRLESIEATGDGELDLL